MNEPMGRRGSLRSARLRRRAREIAMTASSWPMMRLLSSSSILRSFSVSFCSMRWSGTPVHFETTVMNVVLLDDNDLLLVRGAPLGEDVLDFLALVLFLVAQGGGVLEVLAFDRGFLLATIFSISASSSLIWGGRVIEEMRERAPLRRECRWPCREGNAP